ncbi:unnamed protein product [Ilex paraguariensis]|uniref:Protein kinase domain-containing protein n=1 Tax=Ilex paraguariensis TaxID=185542 RepID=A0ABC8RJB7_9AQUA
MASKQAGSPALAPSKMKSGGFVLGHIWGWLLIGIVTVFFGGLLFFCFKRKLYANCRLRRNQKGNLNAEKKRLRQFQLEELEKATNNFSKDCWVGSGAFGDVYQGKFDVEGTLAIKKANADSYTSTEEFRNGQKGAKVLVYEYVPNGSLLDYIMGIAHLHEGITPSIIHRDIKPSNILIGEGFEAKVSDFGLVKSGPIGDQSHVSSQIKGTPGYLDPAYCSSFHLSPFSDVYSFGVILLQLVAGRPAVDTSRSHSNYHIIEWSRPSLERGNVDEILDASLLLEPCNMEMMLKMGLLGLRCVVKVPKQRPTMTQVWQELEAALHSSDNFINNQPSKSARRSVGVSSQSTDRGSYRSVDQDYSQNSVSIDGIGLQRFHVEMDSLSFQSASLRCLETNSISIDADKSNLRGIMEETSISVDEDFSIPRD